MEMIDGDENRRSKGVTIDSLKNTKVGRSETTYSYFTYSFFSVELYYDNIRTEKI